MPITRETLDQCCKAARRVESLWDQLQRARDGEDEDSKALEAMGLLRKSSNKSISQKIAQKSNERI